VRIPRKGEESLNTYIFFVTWTQRSAFNSIRKVGYGKFIKVKASDITEAHAKVEEWKWLSNCTDAVIEKSEILEEIETCLTRENNPARMKRQGRIFNHSGVCGKITL